MSISKVDILYMTGYFANKYIAMPVLIVMSKVTIIRNQNLSQLVPYTL